jgi:hypothetical protein
MQFEELKRITEWNNKLIEILNPISNKYNITFWNNRINICWKGEEKPIYFIDYGKHQISLLCHTEHWEHEKINKDNVLEILNILINNKFDSDILKIELENYLYD